MQYYGEFEAGEEATVLYRFRTDLEPGDVGFVVSLDVMDHVLFDFT